jgi:diguanylate cyclase (GGDEF)-like protein/PAS domain S-box-containing protein
MERKAKTRRATRPGSETRKSSRGRVAKPAFPLLATEAPSSSIDKRTARPRLKVSPAIRHTFAKVPVGIAHFALDGRYLHVNSTLCALLGYSERELLSRRIQDVTMPEDVPEGEALQRQLVAGKISVFTREKRYRCKSGAIRWCSVAVQLVRGGSGRPEHFISVIDDISHRKEAEGRFEATFNQAAVGIAHTTEEGRIVEVNHKLCEILGYSAEELAQFSTRDLTHADDRDRRDVLRLELLSGERQFFKNEKRYVRKDGTAVWVNRTVTLAHRASTGERYLIQVIEDISERKRTEERLARLTRARRVMAECSHVLVHAADENGMLESMCRIVVDSGGYKLAWVGLATGDPKRPVYPAAHAGFGDDAPMTSPAGWNADGRYQGFMNDAIKSGEPYIARHILNDPAHVRRRGRAVQHGFQSSIALPLKNASAVLGAIAIYAREPDAFDADEIGLLIELTDDIAFGIINLRTRVARREAEAALRESEERFRVLTELSSDWSWEQDTSFKFIDVSRTVRTHAGISAGEHIGKARWELPGTTPVNTTWEEHKAVLDARQPFHDLLLRRAADDGINFVSVSGKPMFEPDGTFKGYRGVAKNVTDRMNAEHALRESERRFRDIFNQAAVGITRVDLNGVLVDVNQKFGDMLGYAREDLIGKAIRDITHPDDYGQGSQYRAHLTGRTMRSVSGEKRFVRRDGTTVWARRTMSAACDEAGNPQYVISVVEDITERKKAEEALRASEEMLSATFSQAGVGIFVTSLDSRYLQVNDKYCAMLGYSRDELLGKSIRDVNRPEDIENVLANRAKVIAGEWQHASHERQLIRKDGTLMWVSHSTTVVRDQNGRPHHFITVAEDISERRRAEEALRRKNELTRLLESLAVAANQARDPVDAMSACLSRIREYTGWPVAHGVIFSGDPGDAEKQVSLWALDRAERWVPFQRVSEPFHLRSAEGGFIADIIRSKRALWIRDISRIGTFHRTAAAQACGIRSGFAFPVAVGGRVVAFLEFYSDVEAEADESLLQVVNTIGTQLGRVAERREAESAVRASEERYRNLFEFAPLPLLVVEEESRKLLAANQAAVEKYGYTREEFLAMTILDLQVAEDRERVAHELDERDPSQGALFHRRHVTKSGEIIFAEVTARPLAFHGRASRILLINDVSERLRAEEALRASEERFRATFEQASVGMALRGLDPRNPRWLRVNQKLCDILGYSKEELLELTSIEVTPPEERGAAIDHNEQLLRGEIAAYSREKRYIRKDGEIIWANISLTAVRGADGQPAHVISIIQDTTDRKRAEQALRESEEQFHQLANNIPQVFWICDAQQKEMIYVSPAYERVTGQPSETLRADAGRWLQAVHEEDRERVRNARIAAAHGKYDEVFRVVRPDGSIRWVRDRAFPIHDAQGKAYRIAGIAEDITDIRESEERLLYLAHYDNLTSLPNRVLFYDRLKQALSQARRNEWVTAVMFLDLDRFKNVNDTLGHGAGDLLLRQVSERLAACVRSGDTVGRLSGDEFSVVLSNLAGPDDASLVAQKIMATFTKPFNLYGKEVFVSASIGITLFPTDSLDQDILIQNADTAMYRAKELGRNSFRFYTPEMNARALEKLSLESSLRRALERSEFLLYYQPKASLSTGEVIGVEALLRWHHPELGLVSPVEFMPMLEETGLIVATGEWVIRTACAQIKAWQQVGITSMPVAVNLSARQFQVKDLGATISHILEEEGIRPDLLELEITESSLASNAEEAAGTLAYLNSLGVRVAIDDFGTGYSSLSRLKGFPLDALKIDGSFVRDITTDADDAAITRAIITMAHSLGLAVIAEGVETEQQLMFLDANGCDQIQGYYFSTPLPAEECTAFLASGRRLQCPARGTAVESPTLALSAHDVAARKA